MPPVYLPPDERDDALIDWQPARMSWRPIVSALLGSAAFWAVIIIAAQAGMRVLDRLHGWAG